MSMSIYENIEAAIVDRLKVFEAAGFSVVPLPETQADYVRPFVNGKITVAYHSSEYKEHNSVGVMSQYEEIRFILSVQSRTLRGTKGVYNITSIIRSALIGFQPAGYWRMWAKESGLQEAKLEDGLWTYYAIFSTKALAVEDFEEELGALLSRLTFDNELTGESSSVET